MSRSAKEVVFFVDLTIKQQPPIHLLGNKNVDQVKLSRTKILKFLPDFRTKKTINFFTRALI